MKPLVSAALLCAALHTAMGVNEFTNIFVQKGCENKEHFIRISREHLNDTQKWKTISGPDSVTQFSVPLLPTDGDGAISEDGITSYPFLTQMYVCSNVKKSQGSFLSREECQIKRFLFYSANETSSSLVECIYYTTCVKPNTNKKASDVFYSRLSLSRPINCYKGHEMNESGTLHVISVGAPCDIPMVKNGDAQGYKFTLGGIVNFTCDPGFVLVGANQAECLSTGHWSTPAPKCQAIECPYLPPSMNAQKTQPNRRVGSKAIYKCDIGYKLQGNDSITCMEQADGTGAWSEMPPICVEITCPQLTAPSHGSIQGSVFTYGHQVRFSCDTGYVLRGLVATVTCGNGEWDAPQPICEIVRCQTPTLRDNILVQPENLQPNVYNSRLTFSCKAGFQLRGSTTIRCLANAQWDDVVPICEAVRCPPLPTPENGGVEVFAFTYGNTATFICFPGYSLVGHINSTCQANATWDHAVSLCRACPLHHYKDAASNEECTACPPYSITRSTASTSLANCLCETGAIATGTDGQCKLIECPELSPPENGAISRCGTEAGSECLFSCNPGFFLHGSGVRRCRASGWSGSFSSCLPCAPGTYKAGVNSNTLCTLCARHATTDPSTPAASAKDCFCKPGYSNIRGQGCEDIDECATNNGNCDQVCTNLDGDHLCSCSIPGYRLDEDGTSCIIAHTCPKLNSGPGHGSLSCRETVKYNSAICHIECQPGFYFVSGVNNYVTCGPETAYEWSHRLVNYTAEIPPCTEEFFVDIKLPMTFKYQSEMHCNNFPIWQSNVIRQLEDAVTNLEECRRQPCIVTDMNITCSNLDGQPQFQSKLTAMLEVLVGNPNENAISPNCSLSCRSKDMRGMLRQTFKIKQEFSNLVDATSPNNLTLTDLPSTEIIRGSFEHGKPQILCEEGRVLTKSRTCSPCNPGYHLPSRESETCVPCPVGTYQERKAQTECLPCLSGSTTLTDASTHPTMCNVVVIGGTDEGVRHQGVVINDAMSDEDVEASLLIF